MLHEVAKAHEDDPEVDLSVPVTDMLTARHLLIELHRNGAKQAQYKATLASIEGEYRGRINTLKAREELVRQSLLNYAQTYGSTSFPDVGGFSVRRTKAKLKVVNTDEAAEWLIKHHSAEDEAPSVEEVTHYLITPVGQSILEDALHGGEVAAGCALVPESESLTVRGLS